MKKVFLVLTLLVFLSLSNVLAQQTKELSILTWAHFIADSDEYLKQLAEEFGKKYGVTVRVDTVSLNDMPAKLAAEMQSQAGHDIVLLMNYSTALYKDHLVPLNDVIAKIEETFGSYQPAAEEASKIGDTWYSVPCYYTPSPGIYRKDYFSEAGVNPPDTWEDLLEAAKKLYETGHPVGLPISHCGDSNDWLLQLLASFGAHPVDQNGKVTINSPETRKAIEYVKELFKYMAPDVLSWDGAGNNRWLLSGVGSYIINSLSAVVSIRKDFPEMFENIGLVLPPKGPAGRYSTTSMYTYGITKWAKDKELAKKFLLFLFEKDNFKHWVQASGGYNMPLFKDLSVFSDLPCWSEYPDIDVVFKIGDYYHLPLWPAPAGGKAQLTYDSYIIPDMFAYAVTGKMSTEEAIQWAEEQLKKIWETQ